MNEYEVSSWVTHFGSQLKTDLIYLSFYDLLTLLKLLGKTSNFIFKIDDDIKIWNYLFAFIIQFIM
jgi:hypothetical protein